MLLCTLAASAIILATPVKANSHSVQFYDNAIQVSQRVLDRSICKDIVRVQPIESEGWDTLTQDQKDARTRQMIIRQTRNSQAVSTHCQLRLVSDGISNPSEECGQGFGKL
jgi:hypothetical protein